jgi:hypothetical protein
MKKVVLFILLFFNCWIVQAKIYRVLFIGNSYTAVNDLPNLFLQICNSMADSVVVNSNLIGGATFNLHSTNAQTISLLQQGNWDFIVLQGQSQEPSFSPTQVATQVFPYAKSLDSMAKLYNPCAEVFYYMTWGRKYGDASNCANYPPICTYTGMQQRLRESYQTMAQNNASNCVPVGVVWQLVRNTDSTIELYDADQSHPTIKGTYVAACTFYQSFFHKNFSANTFISNGVSVAEAIIIQSASKAIVMDSITTWQQYGTMPIANFNTTILNNIANITNTSSNNFTTNYMFGDAQTTQNNATTINHTYNTNGIYTIIQSIDNNCGKTDTASQIITIGNPLSTENFDTKRNSIATDNTITFTSLPQQTSIQLFTITGQLLATKICSNNSICFDNNYRHYPFVIYKIAMPLGQIVTGKIH